MWIGHYSTSCCYQSCWSVPVDTWNWATNPPDQAGHTCVMVQDNTMDLLYAECDTTTAQAYVCEPEVAVQQSQDNQCELLLTILI